MLNHKNLMCLYEVFESDNSVYLCVELLEGGQLYDLVKTKYKFKSSEIIGIMRGLVEGLEHMHAKRMMHRDLKPENLLLRNDRNQ
jgi:calcium-dependent protein kinase